MTIPAAGILKEHFCQGPCACGASIAIVPRNQFLCFLKGQWIVFASKQTNQEPCHLPLLTWVTAIPFKTIFHFLIMFDLIVSQAWRFVFFDLLDKITYKDRFQYSILPSFILISSSPYNLWNKEPDLKYKAVCWEYNVTLKNIINNLQMLPRKVFHIILSNFFWLW